MAGTLRRVAAFARPVVHSGYRAAARLGERAAFRVDPYKRPFTVRYEYPPSATEAPMYGWGRPNHPGIDAALGEHVSAYESQLDAILRWEAELSVISVEPTGPGELVWRSSWLGALDIASLYTVVRDRQPRRYHEVGSGNSTKVAAMARADGGLDLRIRSVDPQPRAEIDAICDEVLRQPFELVADRFVAEIEPGDVVFIDCSHRLFSGSDTTVFWLDVLPRLPVGTVVGVHDIHWPQDYPAEWREFLFNEQYALGPYLLCRSPIVTPFLSCGYVMTRPELQQRLTPMWDRFGIPQHSRRGSILWFTVEA